MQDRNSERARKAKAAIEDVFRLPPENRTLDDKAGPPSDPNAPRGSISANEAEGAPVRKGIGSSISDLKQVARALNERITEVKKNHDMPLNSSLGDLPDVDE
jgi:hypothetical protein